MKKMGFALAFITIGALVGYIIAKSVQNTKGNLSGEENSSQIQKLYISENCREVGSMTDGEKKRDFLVQICNTSCTSPETVEGVGPDNDKPKLFYDSQCTPDSIILKAGHIRSPRVETVNIGHAVIYPNTKPSPLIRLEGGFLGAHSEGTVFFRMEGDRLLPVPRVFDNELDKGCKDFDNSKDVITRSDMSVVFWSDMVGSTSYLDYKSSNPTVVQIAYDYSNGGRAPFIAREYQYKDGVFEEITAETNTWRFDKSGYWQRLWSCGSDLGSD